MVLYCMVLYGIALYGIVLYNIDAVPSAPTLSSGAQIEAAEFDNNPETSLSAIYIYWKAGNLSCKVNKINIY